jgi:transposase-like protein
MTSTERQHLEEITFNLYVDCGRSYAETARQFGGIPASTIRARVRRHIRRLTTEGRLLTTEDIADRRRAA